MGINTGESMTLANKREHIWRSLNDDEYRHQFVEEEINVGIAFQIRALRNRQNLTQEELADKLGVRQPLISSWENPDYGKYTLATLKDLSKSFDVGLLVRFVSFSTLLNWTADLKPDDLAPSSFAEEQQQVTYNTLVDKIASDADQSYPLGPGLDANQPQEIIKGALLHA